MMEPLRSVVSYICKETIEDLGCSIEDPIAVVVQDVYVLILVR